VQETGILTFSTKKPVENFKRKYTSKCNSSGVIQIIAWEDPVFISFGTLNPSL